MESFRRIVFSILLLGMIGTAAELLLLEHTEGFWQLAPLLLILMSFLVIACHAVLPSRIAVRLLQGTMVLIGIIGIVGILLHYRANAEFELEMYPSLSDFELFWKSMKGAMPALAPGTMTVLGLLGLAYTYGHPAIRKSKGA